MSQNKVVTQFTAAVPHIVILSCVLLAVGALGKDLNWDQYNYHLYVAHAFLKDRLSIDLMAASTNTYLNPLPYLPFYWMAMANWPSIAVAAMLAALHAFNISIIWVLSRKVWFAHMRDTRSLSVFATILAAITPVYLAVLGTTFIEASLSVFVLAALLLACLGIKDTDRPTFNGCFAAAGLVLGIAVGFKLTSIVFAAGLGFALLFCSPRRRWVALLGPYAMGLIAGFLITNGWLFFKLWSEFGNPVFPFFNGYFQSRDFLPVNLSHDRFRWNSVGELLSLPFAMTLPYSWVYVEPNLPDVRPTILALAGIALAVKKLIQQFRKAPSPETVREGQASAPMGAVAHAGTRLTVYFFFTSIAFWLVTSANARYGLPLMLLIGPLIVITLSTIIRLPGRRIQLLAVVVFWQLVQQAFAWPPRWDLSEWTRSWYEADVPKRLKEEPFAYVSLGETHSNSFAAPFLHPGSAFTSIAGNTLTISPDAPSSKRYWEFLSTHRNQLRTLYAVRTLSSRISGFDQHHMDATLAPWNLQVDYSDCEFFRINLENPDLNSDPYTGPGPIDLTDRLANKYDTRLAACRIVPGPGESASVRAERARISKVFDTIEMSCPLLFSPRGWYLTKDMTGWNRHYLRSDILLHEYRGQIGLQREMFGPFNVRLGKVEQWERGEIPFKCERLPKHW